ncbi:carboxypeptidase regulatory-like domain-containing protein [Elusimicrobiota bacterium]
MRNIILKNKNFSAVLALLVAVFFVARINSNATLHTVHVVDGAGALLADTTVYAVVYGDNGPDAGVTLMDYTNAQGSVTFNLTDSNSYNIYASKQDYGPTVRQQIYNPGGTPPVWAHSGLGDMISTVTLGVSLDTMTVGGISVTIAGGTGSSILFGNVMKTANYKDLAMSVCATGAGGGCTMFFDNVPTAAADIYSVGVFDPAADGGQGKGEGANVTSAITAGAVANVALDLTNALPPDYSASEGDKSMEETRRDEINSGNIAVEGVVSDINYSSVTVPWGGVSLQVMDPTSGDMWNHYWTHVDENGRFQFFGLTLGTTYYAQAFGGCRMGGDNRCYDGYQSTATLTYPTPSYNDFVYEDSTTIKILRIGLEELAAGEASIGVYVRDDSGRALPGAMVNIWPDGDNWHGDENVTPICGAHDWEIDKSTPGFANANVQATTGYALLEGLRPGNYQINVWTPFNNEGVTYNAGPDGEWKWCENNNNCHRGCYPGSEDDWRVTVDTDGYVSVYNTTGAFVYSQVSSVTVYVQMSTLQVTGNFTGVLTFPSRTDLSAEPITIALRGRCENDGCVPGNFDVIGDDPYEVPSSTYTFSVDVASLTGSSPAQYWLEVMSDYWGVVREGGGDSEVTFTSASVVRNMRFAPAGRITGNLKKPDGTIFTPGQQTDGSWVNAWVQSEGKSVDSWGGGEVRQDGSFKIGGLLPGTYELSPQAWGNVNYASQEPSPVVTVVANADTYGDAKFVNGELVAFNASTASLPSIESVDGHGGEKWKGIRMPAGTVIKGDNVIDVLEDNDWNRTFWFVLPDEDQCSYQAIRSSGGWCPRYVPTGKAYDFYLLRSGEFGEAEDGQEIPEIYSYFTIISSSKNVIVSEDKRSAPDIVLDTYNTVTPVHLEMPVAGVDNGATLTGDVIAQNIIRQQDFESLGGSFENFVKYIPTIALYNSSDVITSAGMVTPPPSVIEGTVGDAIDEAVTSEDWSAWVTATTDLGWAYEIRGIPAGNYTMIGLTPNYPPYTKQITIGVENTTTTIDINWDTEVGSGATLEGVVRTTAAVAIENAKVRIESKVLTKAKSFTTESDGAYSAAGLGAGIYKVHAYADGYAPASAVVDVYGNTTFTQNLSLNEAGGIITGTVKELTMTRRGPVRVPVSGAKVVAYNDTYNEEFINDELALYTAETSTAGVYRLIGVVPGDVYKIFVKSPGRYIASFSTAAIAGTRSGIDFDLDQKPLDIKLVTYEDGSNYLIKILNPNDFATGRMWYENEASGFDVDVATEIVINDSDFQPDGSILKNVPVSDLSSLLSYTLHIEATPDSGGADVIKELTFGLGISNAQESIDDEMVGFSDDGANEVEAGGDDNSSLVIPAGSMIQTSSEAFPTLTFTENSSTTLTGGQAVFDGTFMGSAYTLEFSSVQFTGKPIELQVAYDRSAVGDDPSQLILYHYNSATTEWEEVAGADPVAENGVMNVRVNLNGLQGFAAHRNGKQGMAAFATGGQGFVYNPMSNGSGSGAFMVGVGAATGAANADGKFKQYNYPNPFNLKTKTITVRSGSGGVPTSIKGTYIVITPTSGGTATFKIFNLAGDKVREFSRGVTANIYNYIHWDGKNKSGSDVASGVYFCSVDAPGSDEKKPIKMVVIK